VDVFRWDEQCFLLHIRLHPCNVAPGQYTITITGTSTMGSIVVTNSATVQVNVTSSGATTSAGN